MAKKKAKRYTASFFYPTVVQVIGELSGFEAEKGVHNQDVIQRVLEIHNLDREVMGLSSSRSDKKSEVALRVSWAFRNQRAKYLGKKNPRKAALCVAGDKKGYWALTEEGVTKAKKLSLKAEKEASKKKAKKNGGGSGGNGGGGGGKALPTVEPDSVEETDTDPVGFTSHQEDTGNVLSIHVQYPEHLKGDALRSYLFGQMFKQGVERIDALLKSEDESEDAVVEPISTPEEHNLTAEFLGENWDDFYPKICHYVAKRLPKSDMHGMVEDHVMNYMVDVMSRDGLRSRLEDKGKITATVLGYYAYNAAVTEMRSWGTEPLHRCMHGARTETERTKGWKNPASVIHPDPKKVVRPQGDNESQTGPISGSSGKGSRSVQDWYGEDLRETIDHIRTAEEYLVRCESVLREHAELCGRGKNRGDSWVHLLHRIVEGYGPTEIAREMGVNRSTVSNRVQKVRNVLQEAMSRGRFSEVRGTMH